MNHFIRWAKGFKLLLENNTAQDKHSSFDPESINFELNRLIGFLGLVH